MRRSEVSDNYTYQPSGADRFSPGSGDELHDGTVFGMLPGSGV